MMRALMSIAPLAGVPEVLWVSVHVGGAAVVLWRAVRVFW